MIATVTTGRSRPASRLGKHSLAFVLLLFVGSAFRFATPLRFTNPTVQAFTVTLLEDTQYALPDSLFVSGYSDDTGETLKSVVFYSLPTSGTVYFDGELISKSESILLDGSSSLVYSPNSNFYGLDSVGWCGITSSDDTTNITFSFFEVEAVNDPPIVRDAVYLIEEDNSLSISLSQVLSTVFEDIDGDTASSVQLIQVPQNGKLSVIVADDVVDLALDSVFDLSGVDSILYVPNENYNGTDRWEWNWSDGSAFSASGGEVTVTILPTEDTPRVEPISRAGSENESIALNSSLFQAAFSNPDGGELETIEISVLPIEGELYVGDSLLAIGDQFSIIEGFEIVYIPESGFVGADSWTWLANPDAERVLGTINYVISLPNQGPLVDDVDTLTQEDTPIDFPIGLFTSTANDPEGDLIDRIEFTSIPRNGVWTFGDLFGDTLQEDSIYPLSEISVVSYLPKAHFWGDEELDFRLFDVNNNPSNSATFTLVVEEVNDPPGRFQIIELDDDTLRWSGQSFTVRWSESEEVDLGDTIRYTWFVNLRDSLVQVVAGTNEGVSINLDASFLDDPDVFLMWVEASDGEDITRSANKIFKVINPAITGLDEFNDSNLLVYPNPAVRQVRIEIPHDLIAEPTLQLFNPSGQVVGTWIPAHDGVKMMDLTLPNALASGWYTLKLSGIDARGKMLSRQKKLMIKYP
ncbi:MAG TPA: hypothetical protein DCE41_07490 [Cytophagales bacterium]|nr:hypothetical protein [Cytophagales bacterium]HAA23031.1 hypothetical protein [Cytophagales bacterium]HAP62076.1 hypothetical protein [Cytophagales bacterium]